jgi:hypothetical protein
MSLSTKEVPVLPYSTYVTPLEAELVPITTSLMPSELMSTPPATLLPKNIAFAEPKILKPALPEVKVARSMFENTVVSECPKIMYAVPALVRERGLEGDAEKITSL